MTGSIEVVCGPMFSGKTEELIRRIKRVEIAGYHPLVVKPYIDNRYSYTDIVSHSGLNQQAHVVKSAKEILSNLYGLEEVVAIDEVQFFDEEIIEVLNYLRSDGTRVIVAGLDTDFRGLPFGKMGDILAIANHVDKLKAICHHCRSFNADMTQRLIDNQPAVWNSPTVVVGGNETYEARCIECYEHPVATDSNEQLTLF
jgi:thymidine kinase